MLLLTSGPEFGLAHRLTFALMLIMFLAISLIGPTSGVMAADFDKGKASYEAWDYQTAYAKWVSLAGADDAEAQYNLAFIDIPMAMACRRIM